MAVEAEGTLKSLQCGVRVCIGSGWYCCGVENNQCCMHDDVWNFWWFWMFFVVILVLISACGYCCRRRYRSRRHPDYIVVRGGVQQSAQGRSCQGPPVYGAVDHGQLHGQVHGQRVYGRLDHVDTAPIVYVTGQPGANGPNGPMLAGNYGQGYGAVPPAYSPAVKPPDYTCATQQGK